MLHFCWIIWNRCILRSKQEPKPTLLQDSEKALQSQSFPFWTLHPAAELLVVCTSLIIQHHYCPSNKHIQRHCLDYFFKANFTLHPVSKNQLTGFQKKKKRKKKKELLAHNLRVSNASWIFKHMLDTTCRILSLMWPESGGLASRLK